MPMPRLSTSLVNSSNVILADMVLTWRMSPEYGISLHSREMYQDACDAHAEAVNITRKLFEHDSGQHGTDLADRLRAYGISLHSWEMSRMLVMPMEAVNITRELFGLHLANTTLTWHRLREYGVSLHSREMYQDACDAHAEAVNITHELCRIHSGQHYGADLADRLQVNMACRFICSGCV